MSTTITVRVRLEGWHHWPDAPPHRAYLAADHRHLFTVEATVAVHHDDRDVEFHDLMTYVRDWWPDRGRWGAASCERIARQLYGHLAGLHLEPVAVSVWEDDEAGATYSGPEPR